MSSIILHGRGWGGEREVCCSHRRLSRHSGGYLLFLVCEREWHFPSAVEAHLAVPSAPFISRGLLSWSGTKLAGAYRNSPGSSGRRRHIQGFSDRCAMVLWDCDRLRRLVDHLIADIYTGNGSMKIIFEASGRVKTFPCFLCMHGYKL